MSLDPNFCIGMYWQRASAWKIVASIDWTTLVPWTYDFLQGWPCSGPPSWTSDDSRAFFQVDLEGICSPKISVARHLHPTLLEQLRSGPRFAVHSARLPRSPHGFRFSRFRFARKPGCIGCVLRHWGDGKSQWGRTIYITRDFPWFFYGFSIGNHGAMLQSTKPRVRCSSLWVRRNSSTEVNSSCDAKSSDCAAKGTLEHADLGDSQSTWKMVIYSGFSHWKWSFPIAMLVYQRVRELMRILALLV